MHSSMSQTGTNTYHPFKQIKDKTGQLMQNIRTNLAPKNSPVSLPIRTLSPPLANYPQTNQMLELQQTGSLQNNLVSRTLHCFQSLHCSTNKIILQWCSRNSKSHFARNLLANRAILLLEEQN